ncbi:MAG TPA: LD-carboxypeptidase [Chitinophagaceae bacterium]|nr:LD-carboxypeptidase [Chitinophagaceae bacterium]HAN37469.1 LD-carboxypeptidase [Chitinophagaceae bacterium]
MQRKTFLLQSAAALGGALLYSNQAFTARKKPKKIIQPPFLKTGDTIGIVAPSGYVTEATVKAAIERIQAWGFNVALGNTIGQRWGTFADTDEARAADVQTMINNRNIKAILCARGGYGWTRIMHRINWKLLQQQPKWMIGFSDATVAHSYINTHLHIASIHSKMCNSFPDDWATATPEQQATINSIEQAITGKPLRYNLPTDTNNQLGTVTAPIIGGNLRCIENLAGTPYALQTAGKILVLEDVEEPRYNIDRMFWNLYHSGVLASLKGLIIGGFREKAATDPNDEFGLTLPQIVLEKVQAYNYPVAFQMPIGHQRNNFAIKLGVTHQLNVNAEYCSLEALA